MDKPICRENVFPDHPEWGVLCNQDEGHDGPHARFDTPVSTADDLFESAFGWRPGGTRR